MVLQQRHRQDKVSALHDSTQDGNNPSTSSARTASHLLQGKCDRANVTHAYVYLLEKGKQNKTKMHIQSEFL